MHIPRGDWVFPTTKFGDVNADKGPKILAIAGSFTALACLVVMMRLYVRAFMLKTIGSDDYVMTLAMICSAAAFACFVGQVDNGIGHHITSPKLLENMSTILHWSWFQAWLTVVGISSVKVSIGLFLLRLVEGKLYKRILVGWIIFIIIFTLASVGTLVFQCLPIYAAWDLVMKNAPGTKCYNQQVFRSIGMFNGVINIFTDFGFATLPIPVVLGLKINTRTKVLLVCILGLGYFACAASIVRVVLLSKFFAEPDPFFEDSFQVWADIELNTAILAACFPSLKPLFKFILDSASTFRSSKSRRHSALSSHAKGRYYIHEEDMKLGSLPSHSTTGLSSGKGYNITVIGGGRRSPESDLGRIPSLTSSAPTSRLEQDIKDDSGSEDNMVMPLPLQGKRAYAPPDRPERTKERPRGILRTTEVMVSR